MTLKRHMTLGGLAALKRKLDPEAWEKLARESTLEAGGLVRDSLIRTTGRFSKSGNLAHSWKVAQSKAGQTKVTSNAEYAGIQERGGFIRAKHGGFMAFMEGGKIRLLKVVYIKAKRYLDPALDAAETPVAEMIARRAEEVLAR